ncbi:MAG: prepilin-type N-terminal cleavage/methylation domain-containing protein [Alphaproteobacteria bacterium]|nr:prepilin-type N-terminal cleavage/methylation domain-containing protein [Alphaproteobacteria bacterium]
MHNATSRSGFTLLEISVVLVILGLLTGGIFAGANLIRSMELKSINTEVNEYRTAIAAFQERFHALPGDMNNAEYIWGAVGDTNSGDTCPDDAGVGTETCNGNGNQLIAPTTTTLGLSGEEAEGFYAWNHLHNMGLLRAEVTGVPGAASDRDAVVGTNIPRSNYNKAAGWSILNIPHSTEATGTCRSISASGGFTKGMCRFIAADNVWIFTEINYGNVLVLGAQYEGYYAMQPIIPPQDADSLDNKFDDGLPASGSIIAAGDYAADANTVADCFEASDPNGAGYTTQLDYSVNEKQNGCALIFSIK